MESPDFRTSSISIFLVDYQNQNWHHAFINLAGTWVKYDMANESQLRLQLLDKEHEENQEVKEKQL